MSSAHGTVIGVTGPIVEVEWLADTPALWSTLTLVDDESQRIVVVSSASPTSVYCMLLTNPQTLRRGLAVRDTKQPLSIPVGQHVLGRVFNVFGRQLDDGPPLSNAQTRPIVGAPVANATTTASEVIETGIKPIDFFAPLLRGGKVALVGGAGIGKTVILTELINRLVIKATAKQGGKQTAVFSAVGERSREALELYEDLKKAGVLPVTSVMIGQMGENPAIRWYTAYASATLAEYFRDEGHNVYFFMDNIYRFAQAGNELSTLMHAIPSEDGYQPTLHSEIALLNQRLTSTERGTITSFMALFVPSDDLTDAGVRAILPYVDTTIVLSRDIFQQGYFPAMDLLTSSSTALIPQLVGADHYTTYVAAKQLLERAASLERIVSLVGESEISPSDRETYQRARLIRNYMTQDLFLSQTGLGEDAGFIARSETIRTVAEIVAGTYDDVAPEKLLFIGSITNLKRDPAPVAATPVTTPAVPQP